MHRFTMTQKVAVVTGANKGIGFAIARELCMKFDGNVYLTARNSEFGETAVAALKKDGYNPRFHQLDITDQDSVIKFAVFLRETFGGLDVLVNNAGVAFKINSSTPFGEQAENTIRTNYMGTVSICKALFPLLRPHARVVNISSSCGMLSKIPSPELRKKLQSPHLTVEELTTMMQDFVVSAKSDKHIEDGWGTSAYNVSKVGVTALTLIQQRQFEKDLRSDIIVNAVHPGYVDTDMTNHKGPMTPEQGALAPVYLCLLPKDTAEPKGQMVWADKNVVDWGMTEKKA